MKKLLYVLPVLFTLMFLVSSCDSSTDPNSVENGKLSITSSPSGAQVYEGTTFKTTTPDTALSLSAGSHTLTFKLTGYSDTTITYNIVANTTIQKHVTLTSTLSTAQFGFTTPIQVWETNDPSSSDPSGVQLSTGTAYGVSGANKDLVDLVYRSSDYNFISASDWATLTRITWFKAGTASDISDALAAPAFDAASWTKKIPDTQANYFFAYDNEHHYSKVKIVSRHLSSGPGDYGWVKLEWIFNKSVDDKRF